MIITAWILLIVFGWVALSGMYTFTFGGGMHAKLIPLWVIAVIITALSAGVIWGGLFKGILY